MEGTLTGLVLTVSRWLINLVSMLVVNSEYIRNTVDTDISTVYSLIWYNLDE